MLADMLVKDEDALICDLAETYHIYEWRRLPLQMVATFCVGLHDNSRIKRKISGIKVAEETLILASILDKVSLLLWLQTKDARNGNNKPESLVEKILEEKKKDNIATYSDGDTFEKSRAKILNRIKQKEITNG